MRTRLAIMLAAAAASAALAGDGIATRRFSTFAEFQPFLQGGMEFTARGDTQDMTVTRVSPPASSSAAFPLWNNGVPHAFKIVHNADGVTGIEIDDLFTFVSPIQISPQTNGLLITSTSTAFGATLQLTNLKLTRSPFDVRNVNATSAVPPTELLLVKTIVPLDTFILSGQVTFSWTGALPQPDQQWFELTPVIVCEPCDVDCNGSVNSFDIQPFIDILKIPPDGRCSSCAADTNFDGTLNQFDIQGFVECLGG